MATPSDRQRRRRNGAANYRICRYADDFVVLVSGTEAHAEDLKDEVAAVLAPIGLRLSEEKTTIVHIDEVDQDRALTVLSALAELGTPLTIDDFGTGYASLAYLQRLPIGVIKIDRSFIADISSNSANQTIVRSTISMAHGLGLDVVAEGVETDADRRQLISDGCHLAQGYYFARPMPADDITTWVKAHQPNPVPI